MEAVETESVLERVQVLVNQLLEGCQSAASVGQSRAGSFSTSIAEAAWRAAPPRAGRCGSLSRLLMPAPWRALPP